MMMKFLHKKQNMVLVKRNVVKNDQLSGFKIDWNVDLLLLVVIKKLIVLLLKLKYL